MDHGNGVLSVSPHLLVFDAQMKPYGGDSWAGWRGLVSYSPWQVSMPTQVYDVDCCSCPWVLANLFLKKFVFPMGNQYCVRPCSD